MKHHLKTYPFTTVRILITAFLSIMTAILLFSGCASAKEKIQPAAACAKENYTSDEAFANFTEIISPGLKKGIICKSICPFGSEEEIAQGSVRYSHASNLAAKHKIRTIIELSSTESKIKSAFQTKGYDSGSYAKKIYDKGNVIALGIGSDFFDEEESDKIALALRFMISHPAPYLISCRAGDDIADKFAGVLEAITGSSIQKIKDNYMTSYANDNRLEKGSKRYDQAEKNMADQFIRRLCNLNAVSESGPTDPSKPNITELDVRKGAEEYLTSHIGLSRTEYDHLLEMLSK